MQKRQTEVEDGEESEETVDDIDGQSAHPLFRGFKGVVDLVAVGIDDAHI